MIESESMKLKYIPILVVFSILSVWVYTSSFTEKPEVQPKTDYNVYALEIPEYIDFAGEPLPLNQQDIQERLDRELLVNTYWQSNGLLMIKRSNKFFPIIEPILEKHGIPNDFKYLALIESGLTNVTSRAGASGFWQILKNTGKELGLEVNENVDERYHVEKATEAACKYLLQSKKKFGSWTLAAAAYNAGNGRIAQRMEEQQVSSYYDLLLNQETGRYVFRIVAVKHILSNAYTFGFNYQDKHLYQLKETYKMLVDTPITDIVSFAKRYNLSYKEFKIYNPWLRERHLNNKSGKEYIIEIPKN